MMAIRAAMPPSLRHRPRPEGDDEDRRLYARELKKIGAPGDPASPAAACVKDATQALFGRRPQVATGSQDNVRRAYSSGTLRSASAPAMCR
jgi:hypothetical protein